MISPEAVKPALAYLLGVVDAAHGILGQLEELGVEQADQIKCGLEDLHGQLVEALEDDTTGPEALASAL